MAVNFGNAFDYFNLDEDVGIPATTVGNELNKVVPIFASEDIAARNVGVPQDNRFTGIMRNFTRPLMFQGGAQAGLKLGQLATGTFNPLFALAGAIGSQFLPLDRRPSDLDYQYVNDPNNMGGLRVVDNKIIDPSGILSGKNFASGFGSNSLATMYEKEIDRLGGFITDLRPGNIVSYDGVKYVVMECKHIAAQNISNFEFLSLDIGVDGIIQGLSGGLVAQDSQSSPDNTTQIKVENMSLFNELNINVTAVVSVRPVNSSGFIIGKNAGRSTIGKGQEAIGVVKGFNNLFVEEI